jgi:hypothetical protein
MPGYWWQCDKDASHVATPFRSVTGIPLVQFLFDLAERGWEQKRLAAPCGACQIGTMRITYEFPREDDRVRLAVNHIVGVLVPLDNGGSYLPMLWQATPIGGGEPWFDFKYVQRSKEGYYRGYGLARPGVFTRSTLAELFDAYCRVIGRPLLE